jgi:hypothetical protein
MFLIELYLKKRKAKLRAWERAGKEWVEERNKASSYNAYSFEDYAKRYPAPVFPWKKVLSIVFTSLACIAIVTFVVWRIASIPPKKIDPNNPNDCSTVVKKGDKVGVTGGDFEGSKGVVIEQRKDCSVNLTLTESTWTYDQCHKKSSGYCSESKEKDEILTVDHSQDIVKL